MTTQPAAKSIGPFAAQGNWYRGALHVHTTNSDGRESPAMVLKRYHDAGYHFVVLTDHNKVTRAEGPEGLLVLPGIELDCSTENPTKFWHVVGVGCEREPDAKLTNVRDIVKYLRKHAELVLASHPYWSNLSGRDLRSLNGCDCIEVYNSVCELMVGRGSSEPPWDHVLSTGQHVHAVAVDDSHQRPNDLGRAWVMVKAPELSARAIYDALKNGCFYSSTGPEIHDWTRADALFGVKTSPCRTISFMSNTWYGGRFEAEPGSSQTQAEYHLEGSEIYLRVQVTDAECKRAWTNPIYLK